MNWQEYKEIARQHVHRYHGGFLTAFLQAFIHADKGNTRILLPAMKQFCQKYRLEE